MPDVFMALGAEDRGDILKGLATKLGLGDWVLEKDVWCATTVTRSS